MNKIKRPRAFVNRAMRCASAVSQLVLIAQRLIYDNVLT